MEEWKKVEGWEYEVSTLGNVRNIITGKAINPWTTNYGYVCASLHCGIKKNKKHKLVHKLVMQAFVGESTLTVNHKDGNRKNNNLSNLEYVTLRENRTHAVKSKYPGCSYNKKSGKWYASIYINRKSVWIGSYDTPEEGSQAYLKALQKYKLENKYARQ